MAETSDDLEKLLTDVRKTISDNELFLKKLVDETADVGLVDASENMPSAEDFEEL